MRLVRSTLRRRFCMNGYGLVELMVSMALAAIMFTAICQVLANQEIHNARAEQYYLIQHEAKSLLMMMQRDLSRAGFRGDLDSDNPFVYLDPVDSSVDIYTLNSDFDCITYRYDRNEDGLFSGENFGFRLHNEALQLRKGSDVNCDGGLGWEAVSDPSNIIISDLRFSIRQTKRVSVIERESVKAYVTIAFDISHRQLPDVELSFSRNSSVRVLL